MFRYDAKASHEISGTNHNASGCRITAAALAAEIVAATRIKAAAIFQVRHEYTGSHAQQRTATVLITTSARLPAIAHATPVVTYNASHTLPNTKSGGVKGAVDVDLRSLMLPHFRRASAAVAATATPNAAPRITILASIAMSLQS